MHIRTITSVLITMLFAALALGALAPAATHAAPESWDPKWHSVIVDNGNDDTGSHSSIAFNPVNYNPYVSYYRGSGRLNLAYYTTGSGLTCNEGWNCYNLDGDGTSQTGSENSMVFDANGTAWIGYNDPFYAETKLLSLDTNFNKSISVLRGDSGPGSVPSGADHMSFPSVGLLGGSPVVAVYDSFASIGGQWTIPRLVGLNYWHWDIEEYSQDTTVGYYLSLDWNVVCGQAAVAYRGNGNSIFPQSHTLNYAIGNGTQQGWCQSVDNTPTGWDCHLSLISELRPATLCRSTPQRAGTTRCRSRTTTGHTTSSSTRARSGAMSGAATTRWPT